MEEVSDPYVFDQGKSVFFFVVNITTSDRQVIPFEHPLNNRSVSREARWIENADLLCLLFKAMSFW